MLGAIAQPTSSIATASFLQLPHEIEAHRSSRATRGEGPVSFACLCVRNDEIRTINTGCKRVLFGLGGDEQAVCFVKVGTVNKAKVGRVRPSRDQFVTGL